MRRNDDEPGIHLTFALAESVTGFQLTGDREIIRKSIREQTQGARPLDVAVIFARSIIGGQRLRHVYNAATCEAADRLASRLGLSAGVRRALSHIYTRQLPDPLRRLPLPSG